MARNTNVRQLDLPFDPLRNSHLFSNHWLEARLPLEPEWDALFSQSQACLERLILLWREQRHRVEQYGDEPGLEQAFIQPVLTELGWKLKYQTFVQGRKPDYALFLDDDRLEAALRAGRHSPEFWEPATLVADAKAWDVNLDRPLRAAAGREFPPEQMEWYLDRTLRDFGILSNGHAWRLVPRVIAPHQPRFQTYLECDLRQLLDAAAAPQETVHERQRVLYEFHRFWLLFGPSGFSAIDGRLPLVTRAIAGSSEYRLGIGEGLKGRTFEALRLCIEGFISTASNNLSPASDLELCREQSFVLLYRLLFVMYAEDRGLLPYRRNDSYTKNRSLGEQRDQIAAQLDRARFNPRVDFARTSATLWSDLRLLFDLVDRGHGRYGVPAYNGGLFNPNDHPFLADKVIADWYLARVIDQLSRSTDPENPGRGLFRVDYRDLAIQHLGAVYEGLLELRPEFAQEDMIVVRQAETGKERIVAVGALPAGFIPTSERYERGSYYLRTDKGERRASGSYYTPDQIVSHLIQVTIRPLCERLSREVARQPYQGESFDVLALRLRVLDPAMGSGHFLLRACQYLAEEIATNPRTADLVESSSSEPATLSFWKRRVVECCLYGVDKNPLAVELARLALWLETVSEGRPLSFLDHHLRTGDSLVGARIEALGTLPHPGALFENSYAHQVDGQLPTILGALAEIRSLPSNTMEQIQRKEQVFRLRLERVREPFRRVADLWCAAFFPGSEPLSRKDYQRAIDSLSDISLSHTVLAEPWAIGQLQTLAEAMLTPFHWEIELPEVFFNSSGRRTDAGFDAIVGNPPYDVLSELESGRRLDAFRAFVGHEDLYAPSLVGKNNLYKLFICRCLWLLAPEGRLGFITPMAILGDEQARELRRSILEQGALTNIEAFPQKDDARQRVFPDAKLSTAVFSVVKTSDPAAKAAEFVSRVHPGRIIEAASPSLRLRADEIPRYDPRNLTIVSCSQADWELAVRITSNPAGSRLGDHVEFFQGEVNETNERKRGTLGNAAASDRLVTRGAGICLYAVREASQGNDLYINVDRFLSDRRPDSKAFHHRQPRVVLQESSPQNNFRRIIAALLPAGEFCNHTINYAPQDRLSLDLEFLLGLLNSKLADWYFRLGSTNAHVSHYQLYNLPCPGFDEARASTGNVQELLAEVSSEGVDAASAAIFIPAEGPAPGYAHDIIVAAVGRIRAIEAARGDIARKERSALSTEAQPYQDLIDNVLYRVFGLCEDEWRGLEMRLATML